MRGREGGRGSERRREPRAAPNLSDFRKTPKAKQLDSKKDHVAACACTAPTHVLFRFNVLKRLRLECGPQKDEQVGGHAQYLFPPLTNSTLDHKVVEDGMTLPIVPAVYQRCTNSVPTSSECSQSTACMKEATFPWSMNQATVRCSVMLFWVRRPTGSAGDSQLRLPTYI